MGRGPSVTREQREEIVRKVEDYKREHPSMPMSAVFQTVGVASNLYRYHKEALAKMGQSKDSAVSILKQPELAGGGALQSHFPTDDDAPLRLVEEIGGDMVRIIVFECPAARAAEIIRRAFYEG